MKNIALLIFLLIPNFAFWEYKLDDWSKKIVSKYSWNKYYLSKEITRKEFVKTLSDWYKDYKFDRGIKVDYSKYKKLDNEKIFKDVDLESDFWKKLSYFAWIWVFAKNEYFNPNETINQKTYFVLMRRLKVMYGLNNCTYHKICEKELDENSIFNKWVYYKYTSKILDKKLRKHFTKPEDYIKAWYKPKLTPNYYFPILGQTLNWCYAFAIRNILKYKYWIGVYVSKIEREIGKKWTDLWRDIPWWNMSNFDKVVHISKKRYYTLDNFISSLQSWEPVIISYLLEYVWRDWKKRKIWHVVAAYSFDEKWVWVAETVKAKRVRVPWNEIFNSYWYIKRWRIFKINYQDKSNWTDEEIKKEKLNNFITREY